MHSSASTIHQDESVSVTMPTLDLTKFNYKVRDVQSGKHYRFTSSCLSLSELRAQLLHKIGMRGGSSGAAGGGGGGLLANSNEPLKLFYQDDDADYVHLGSDADLVDAVGMARRLGWSRLLVFVGTPPSLHPPPPPPPPQQQQQQQSLALTSTLPGNSNAVVVSSGGGGAVEGRRGHREGIAEDTTAVTVVEFLRDAPFVVNVAISAGIVVVAAAIISKLSK
jgi:hypothetical protein